MMLLHVPELRRPLGHRLMMKNFNRRDWLFNVTYFDGALAPLLDSNARKCRIKYHPRDMSAVFVELPTGGHLRLPCADLGRPAVTLWEQRAAPSAGIPCAMRAEPWPASPARCARRAAPTWTRRRC